MQKWLVLAMASALMLTGCMFTGDQISDGDLERWQAAADQSLPGASKVAVTVEEVYCYIKCGEDLQVAATFTSFEELVRHEDELLDLREFITSDSSKHYVNFILNVGDTDEAAQAASNSLNTVVGGGLTQASVSMGTPVLVDSGIYSRTHLRLYFDDPTAATPDLLRQTMDAATDVLSALGVTVEFVLLFTMDGMGLTSGAPGYSEAIIDPRELDSFTSNASGDCVVEGQWAFDITAKSVVPYRADSPEGACA